jgi:hypothetical protein
MAMDYLGTPATSTPSEHVNSAAGSEFTSAPQSLSSSIFIQTICLRSWMDAGILKLPVNRAQEAADAATVAVCVINLLYTGEDWRDWQGKAIERYRSPKYTTAGTPAQNPTPSMQDLLSQFTHSRVIFQITLGDPILETPL